MMYIKYVFLLLLDLIGEVVNLLLAPIVVLFADDYGWLPKWLSWFQTNDNSLYGDHGWQTEHLWFKNKENAEELWINKVRWLYRNDMYGFAINVLGANIHPDAVWEERGNPKVSTNPLCNGYVYRKLTNPDGKSYFQFYYVKQWSSKFAIRINIGWKIWGEQLAKDRVNNQFVFSPNPFQSWSK
jgi:hypothetical protein